MMGVDSVFDDIYLFWITCFRSLNLRKYLRVCKEWNNNEVIKFYIILCTSNQHFEIHRLLLWRDGAVLVSIYLGSLVIRDSPVAPRQTDSYFSYVMDSLK